MRDDEVLRQLAEQIARGAFTVASVHEPAPDLAVPTLGALLEGSAEQSPLPVPAALTHFIEVRVVLASGEGVGSVALEVVLPTEEVQRATTDGEGMARLDAIPAGTCVVRCTWSNPSRAETLAFVGLKSGSGAAGDEAHGAAAGQAAPPLRPKTPEDEGEAQKPSGKYVVSQVERRKVGTGDTLASLAESVGITWKELAKFNFGTDDPKKINAALRRVVGCTKKTKDGKNYRFDDTDDPGIVLLPSPFELKGLSTGTQHTIVVNKVELTKKRPARWTFSM
ncbi:LysM peptidoglycan-binding domain-containing protein [Chondromyces apiculatus]|uniref:LysM peptidoglycan-binding domain-containing protein n=1 Tax=Chondromyces apiculatus TaxID=51 RepID=UPI0018CC705A|nr:LysM peptidoglycan-binding domain-containing protein [Chondromyces apiculatus]